MADRSDLVPTVGERAALVLKSTRAAEVDALVSTPLQLELLDPADPELQVDASLPLGADRDLERVSPYGRLETFASSQQRHGLAAVRSPSGDRRTRFDGAH
jgi:hypothetical protein